MISITRRKFGTNGGPRYIYKLYTCTRASREVRSCFIFSFGHSSFVNLSI